MGSVRAEFLKLKRSLSWAVVVLLPVLAVATGAVNTVASGQALDDGWHALWLRVVVFHGLFPLTVGISVLASLVWRVEHRGGNRAALLSTRVPAREIVLGKLAVLAALIAGMQAVLVVGVLAVGKLVFGLPGVLPPRYLLVSAVVVLACLPVAAWQSGLSMVLRTFAAPVAVGLVGAVASVPLLLSRVDALAVVVPYALVGRATQLGTGVFADAGPLTPGVVAPVVAAALVLTAVVVAAAAAVLDRTDAR